MAESQRLCDKSDGSPVRLIVQRAVTEDASDIAGLATKACGRPIPKESIFKLDLAAKTVCVTARFKEPKLLMGYSSATLTDDGTYTIRSLVLLEPSDIGTTTELIHGLIRELRTIGGRRLLTRISKDNYEFYAEFGFRSAGQHQPGENIHVALNL
jgi:hypothetical protein